MKTETYLKASINPTGYRKTSLDWAILIGRIFYGIAIAGIGLLHFVYSGFRPLILPLPGEVTASQSVIAYLIGAYILFSGIMITAGKRVYTISLLLGMVFLLFLLFGHLPIRLLIQNNPEIAGNWINTIKLLALSGGAFLVARISAEGDPNNKLASLRKYTAIGSYFFAFMLLIFGLGHLVSAQKISLLVPKYIPNPVFWAYISGVALIGSGLCIVFRYKLKLVGVLLSVMLFLWLLMLHLYYAFRFPHFQDGENIMGSFHCLAFCGIALLVSQLPNYHENTLKKQSKID